MRSDDEERCAELRRVQAIDEAFGRGDLEALRAAVGDPEAIPNGFIGMAFGPCLEYAIYHSPLAFVRELLELGADVNPTNHGGFPPLIATLTGGRSSRDAGPHSGPLQVLRLLLEFGADPDQRGFNDYTPLHYAVETHNLDALDILLAAGANPTLATRIDDLETPRELAEKLGLAEYAVRLRAAEEEWRG